jgi:aminoglycoside phosphotransferase (APT) family kinase protein
VNSQPDEPASGLRVASSVDALFGTAVRGEALAHDDGKTGARLERVVVDGQRYVLKHLHAADDWVMRATADIDCRPVTLWRHGWLDALPACIDHAIVGAAWDDRPGGRGAVLVMRDVGAGLVPEGDSVLPLTQHLAFLDHMAQLHAAFWGRGDTVGLLPLSRRFDWFGPRLAEAERARGGTDPVPTQLVPEGWARFARRAPRAAEVVFALLDDPTPLVAALETTPQTLVHGDWKAGNLGSHPDGRTILLDWAIPGIAPACADIAWYICLNRARLPQTKEATLDAYRDALERHGVDTRPWWERQRALSLLGTLLLFGWEKALGEDDELAWWPQRALEGAKEL